MSTRGCLVIIRCTLLTGHSGGQKPRATQSKTDRCFLPHFMLYVAWSLCFVVIVGCTGISVYFGIRYIFPFCWMLRDFTTQILLRHMRWLLNFFYRLLNCFQYAVILTCLKPLKHNAIRYNKANYVQRLIIGACHHYITGVQLSVYCRKMRTTTSTTTILWPFVRDYPGESVPEG